MTTELIAPGVGSPDLTVHWDRRSSCGSLGGTTLGGTTPNYNGKIEMVNNILEDIKKRKILHYKQFAKFKKANTISKSVINSLNAISVCSMVLTFTPVNSAVMLVAIAATSVSGITSAIHSSIDIEGKIHSHNTSYLQYTDLYRDVSARLLRNGMSTHDLDLLLSEMNARIGLIEDSSLPISF